MDNKNLGNKVISGLVWKFMERICAQLVTFVVSIILARLLMPSDYGTIAIVMVFISIANIFVTSGFGTALVQKKEADSLDFSSVFYFNILFSIGLYVLLLILAPLISKFYNMPILTPVLRVLSVKLILAGINSVQQAYVSKKMMFKRFFWSTLIGTLGSAVVGIGMALTGFGIWALVAQYLFNSIIDTLVLWFTVKWRPTLEFSFSRLKQLIAFGWKILMDNLIISLYDNMRSLIIGKVYSSSDLAYYSKGINFPSLIVTNINSSIGSVLFPALTQLQDDYDAIKRAVKRSIKISSLFMMPLMMGLFAVASNFIEVILTDKWMECVPYLRIACVYYAFFPITTANLQALNAIGKSDITLRLTLIKRITGILLVVCVFRFGILAIAMTDIYVTFLAVIVNTYYNSIYFNYSLLEQLKDIGPSIICACIMGILTWVIGRVLINELQPLLVLVVQIILGGVVYSLFSILINREDVMYIIRKIRK